MYAVAVALLMGSPVAAAEESDQQALTGEGLTNSTSAPTAPYDLQFLDTMIVHHQATIEMAQVAQSRAQHAELKGIAQKLADQEQQEMATMRSLREQWYPQQPSGINLDVPGMKKVVQTTAASKMKEISPDEFDLLFVELMAPYLARAVLMAQEAQQKATHEELRALAQTIIERDRNEIHHIMSWMGRWRSGSG
jgi:uncharacterized protein (DUF305 family)